VKKINEIEKQTVQIWQEKDNPGDIGSVLEKTIGRNDDVNYNVKQIIVVQPITDEPQVIVNMQLEVAITMATTARITNDEFVEISYEASVVENVIGEKR